jgi:hypothetical protein
MLIDALLDRKRISSCAASAADTRNHRQSACQRPDRQAWRFALPGCGITAAVAIDRILTKSPGLPFDRSKIIAVIERELSVPPQRWRGYHLLDRPEAEPAGVQESSEDQSRHLEHIFQLLSTIVGREPLDAAVHGVRSPLPGLRGLAIEYLDQVLPPAVLERLRELIATTPSGGDVPAQSAEQPTARQSSGEH